jgi:glucose/arabinose dehydrogenase
MLLCILSVAAALTSGCYAISPSSGGGQTHSKSSRQINPADVVLPQGYRIEVVAKDLTFPTGIAFDDNGKAYVIEAGYSYGEVWTTPRLLRLDGGSVSEIARGDKPPWTGIAFHQGKFYIAEGGGRIVSIDGDGKTSVLADNLPSVGDHHTNGPAISPDGRLYFAIGTATNSAVVGEDNYHFGWLKRNPEFHDIPGKDIRLTGENFTTNDPLHGGKAMTGAYLPFGTASQRGQVIKGQVPCTGGVFRMPIGGGNIELVAWGLRNPFGMAFSPDGQLFITENSYDDRGSRPVWGTGDLLWRIEPGMWYGWPDYHDGEPLTQSDHFRPPGESALKPLLAERPNDPPASNAKFGVHSSACGLDFSRSERFGHRGEAFVALFGDMAPGVGKTLSPVGFKVVRVDTQAGVIHDFAINRGKYDGPASSLGHGGLERPVAVRFNPDGDALYVVDFGIMTMDGKTPKPVKGSGVVWRITRGSP